MPKISVIVPVYNVEPYIRRCVDSILAQSISDFELILVDDGSPDNCGKICDEYAEKDDRVHVIHQENGGLSAARNAGIDYAFANSDSEWLTFIDSDDWIHPKTLELLYNAAIENNVSVSCCGYARTDGENPDVDEEKCVIHLLTPEEYYLNNNATACDKLYKRQCFEKIRFPAGKLHEDEFTIYRIIFSCDMIALISEPLYAYFVNQNGIMHSEWSPKKLDMIEALEYQLDFFKRINNTKVLENRLHYFLMFLSASIDNIENSNLESNLKHNYTEDVKKTIKRTLKTYSENIILSDNEKEWVFGKIYPKRTKIISFLQRRTKK